jgi:hypothetical protein
MRSAEETFPDWVRKPNARDMKSLLSIKHLVAAATIAAVTAQASAQLSYTFDTDAQGFQNFVWSASGPTGWSGGAAVQAPAAVGGWTLGGSFNFGKEFNWPDQITMQTLSSGGNARLSFDLIVDGSSFTPGVAGWYNINIAGNSGGANGWTQVDSVTGAAWHNADDNTAYSTHVDLSFAQLGWQNTEDATGWFQIYFGANSGAAFPVKFYVDNLTAAAPVPEPSTFALAGLGSLACLIFRRRR